MKFRTERGQMPMKTATSCSFISTGGLVRSDSRLCGVTFSVLVFMAFLGQPSALSPTNQCNAPSRSGALGIFGWTS